METCIAMLVMFTSLPGILAAILALALVCFVWLPRTASADEKTPEPVPAASVTVKAVKGLSRAEIQQKLQKLAETPPPKDLKHGAKCYDMSMPPNRVEYVCPTCGEKTLYTNQAARVVSWDVKNARRQIKELQKVAGESLALDESQFCRKCSPDIKDPKLVLKIGYEDAKPHIVSGITPEDLLLLTEFFSGKRAHDREAVGEKPLKDYSKRLQELLGVEGVATK